MRRRPDAQLKHSTSTIARAPIYRYNDAACGLLRGGRRLLELRPAPWNSAGQQHDPNAMYMHSMYVLVPSSAMLVLVGAGSRNLLGIGEP
jgi:hypothetical protein